MENLWLMMYKNNFFGFMGYVLWILFGLYIGIEIDEKYFLKIVKRINVNVLKWMWNVNISNR